MVMAVTAGHKVLPAGVLLKDDMSAGKCISPDVLGGKYNVGSLYVTSGRGCIFRSYSPFYLKKKKKLISLHMQVLGDAFYTYSTYVA